MIRSWLSRRLAPHLAWCLRCETSMFGPIRNDPHSTPYGVDRRSCFPLCERCWLELTPAERLSWYDALVDWWVLEATSRKRFLGEFDQIRAEIREAVIAGG